MSSNGSWSKHTPHTHTHTLSHSFLLKSCGKATRDSSSVTNVARCRRLLKQKLVIRRIRQWVAKSLSLLIINFVDVFTCAHASGQPGRGKAETTKTQMDDMEFVFCVGQQIIFLTMRYNAAWAMVCLLTWKPAEYFNHRTIAIRQPRFNSTFVRYLSIYRTHSTVAAAAAAAATALRHRNSRAKYVLGCH